MPSWLNGDHCKYPPRPIHHQRSRESRKSSQPPCLRLWTGGDGGDGDDDGGGGDDDGGDNDDGILNDIGDGCEDNLW